MRCVSCCNFALPMLRLIFCETHVATLRNLCCDFARPMLRLCATHVATLCDPCCDFARHKLPLCATRVANLRDPCCEFKRSMFATIVPLGKDKLIDHTRNKMKPAIHLLEMSKKDLFHLRNQSRGKERIQSTQMAKTITKQTRLLVSGRSPECSDCLLRFMKQ